MTESLWNLPAPPGFNSFDPQKPVKIYQRALPHWRQDGATYFVTFRQQDSLPQSVVDAARRERIEWERRNPEPRSESQWDEIARLTFRRMEQALDAGTGSCVLKTPKAQCVLTESLPFFDGTRYDLNAYVVMPNHVHLLVRPREPGTWPLEDILHSWKRHTAQEINRLIGACGRFWQEESFDRIVRDEEHLYRCVQYIGDNADKAGLPESGFVLWNRPDWESCGWGFRRAFKQGHARVGNPCYGGGGPR